MYYAMAFMIVLIKILLFLIFSWVLGWCFGVELKENSDVSLDAARLVVGFLSLSVIYIIIGWLTDIREIADDIRNKVEKNSNEMEHR